MAIELLMPALSPTMKEGKLAKWNKKEGDKVKIGEVIAEIETDKATMEVESIDEGIMGKIFIEAGTENVAVNKLIAILLEEGEDQSALDKILLSNNSGLTTGENAASSGGKIDKEEPSIPKDLSKEASGNEENRIFISPLAKRIAEQNSVNLDNIMGSGPKGRIIKSDVENAIAIQDLKAKTVQSNINSNINSLYGRDTEEYTKIPNNNMRKVIARRLTESKKEIPHFYLEIECEMDKLLEFRKEINATKSSEGSEYKISVNDLIIKAVALSLKKVPEANASWTEEAVLRYNNIDISVAVAIEGGLITPIVQNADQKSLVIISEQMKDLATRARNSSLKPEEFQGGTFTISNLGMFGIDSFKAIINPPQSGILAIGRTVEKAVVKEGKVTIASVMKVTLSSDHRVIDGSVGAKFLAKFRECIERPMTMLVY